MAEPQQQDQEQPKLRLGGMALRNGLLVHGPTSWAIAVRTPGGELRMTVSIGVRTAVPGDDLHRLLADADRRLYLAKAGGRNRVVASG